MEQIQNLSEQYEYTRIRKNIWQIAEDNGVYCTLVMGSTMAVLIDTGFGNRNLREFVENHITTPYMVINSHGHPDHIGGNHWFDTVWAAKEEWDVIWHFEKKQQSYELKEIKVGDRISLGDTHIEIVSLAGHTKGSIGFLVQEEGLLIAGDAFNEGLWLFNYGSLSMQNLYESLQKAMQLDFASYICGHSNEEYKKEKLLAHMKNIETLKVDESTKRNLLGFETYCSAYQDANGKSEILFTEDKALGIHNIPVLSV